MKMSPSQRQAWDLAPRKNESQKEYQQALAKLTGLFAEKTPTTDFLHQATAQAKQYLNNESQDYSQLIKDFEAWLEQYCTQKELDIYLSASLVSALAEGDFATLMPRFLGLKYHSASLGRYWVGAVILACKSNPEFKVNLVSYAKQQVIKLDKQIAERYPVKAQLSWIWPQHYDRHNDLIDCFSDWPWFDVLWQLESADFLRIIVECKSPYTVSGIFIWAGLSDNFQLWQQAMCAAPSAFTENGGWNGSFLLPMLLTEASQRLLESVSAYTGYPQQPLDLSEELEIKALIHDIATTISARKDFADLIRPWAIQLFNSMSNHLKNGSVEGQLYQAFLIALIEQLPSKHRLSEVADSENSENWLYLSLLGWVVSNFPQASISFPNPERFVEQWQFNHHPENSWLGIKGEKLLKVSREFSYQELSSAHIEYLAVSLTFDQPEKTAKNWQKMWQGMHQLREAVKFNTPESKVFSVYSNDAARLNYLLLSIGLAMLKQLDSMALRDGQWLETTINDLFTSLWQASFTLLRIDSFNKDKIHTIQLHLLLLRALWQKTAEQGQQQYALLNKTLTLTHVGLLQDLQSDVILLIESLPNYKENSIPEEWLKNELTVAGLSIQELLSTAEQMVALNTNRQRITEQSLDTLRRFLAKYP